MGRESLLYERHGRPKRDWGQKGGMGNVQEERATGQEWVVYVLWAQGRAKDTEGQLDR